MSKAVHAIYFRWKVASGCESDFEQAWLELTELVRKEQGGLGSRLHRCADGHYFAYAQWPSESVWEGQPKATARMIELRNRMREVAELVDGPVRGDVVADLLKPMANQEDIMQIPMLGNMTLDERYGWIYSAPVYLKMLDRDIQFILEAYEEDGNKQDFELAIREFLSLGHEVLNAAEPHIFAYYRDVNGDYWEPSDQEYVGISTPGEVWDHIEFGEKVHVLRRFYGDKGVYVSMECNCDWEPEHGLQIIFRNGQWVSKVGSYDGHLSNADAYADEQLDNIIYVPRA